MKNIKIGYTHSGKFHADDIFASALLKILFPGIEIKRVSSIPEGIDVNDIENGYIVYDIGGGRFDHHEPEEEKEYRENGVVYAAFGKLWREFGYSIVNDESSFYMIDIALCEYIDSADNYGTGNPLSFVISNFNPDWDSEIDSDDSFNEVVEVAKKLLKATIDKALAKERAMEAIKDEAFYEGNCMLLPRYIPWQCFVKDLNIDFVIFPSNRGEGYNVMTVPSNGFGSSPRIPFPYEWWGNKNKDLGMTFCHSSGFMAVAETLEQAKELARIATQEFENLNDYEDEGWI